MSLKTAISVPNKNYLPLLGPFGFNMWAEFSYCLIRFNMGKKNLHSGVLQVKWAAKDMHFDIYRKSSEDSPLNHIH